MSSGEAQRGGAFLRVAVPSGLALLAAACASTAPSAPGPTAPTPKATPPASPAPVASAFTPDATLTLCPTTVTNAPKNVGGKVEDFSPYVSVNGVTIAVSPVNGACLSSGFGPRGKELHKGVDFQIEPAQMVHAAAGGRIVEAGRRPDFGNYVVIDHGKGVFTRYAHLAALESGVREGARIPFGTRLGIMGQTAAFPIPVHLHYELLVGDYDTPKKSFGLTPTNIFEQPRARGAGV